MDPNRRDVLGLLGAAAAATMVGTGAEARPTSRTRNLGSASKTLYWIAAATPCNRKLKFDPGAFRDMLAYFRQNGADGVVVLGTSGEFPSFSVSERKAIAEAALRDKLGMNIIVGPGTPNLAETMELCSHAQDHGADGLLIIPPFYYKKPSTEGLVRYYSAIFERTSIAINLYHIPATSGVSISHELLRRLMQYPHLAGIKDSSGPAEEYAEFVNAFGELNIRAGIERNLPYALEHGMGAICQGGNVFTRAIADVFSAHRKGVDVQPAFEALKAQVQIMQDLQTDVWSLGPMKYALSLQMGAPQFWQRPPHDDVTDTQKASIREALARIKGLS